MNNLAVVLISQGKYEEAETMHRQTLEWREKVLGCEHLDTLTSVYYLVYLLINQRYYSEALALYKRACAGYEAVLGKDHLIMRACYQNYADAFVSHKEHQRAISPTITDNSAHIYTGKQSKLVRGLAKIGIRSSKSSARWG